MNDNELRLENKVAPRLVIGNTYQSSRGFGRLTYIGETSDIDGYLPTFRKQDGGLKFYSHDDLSSALVEFAAPTVSRADELIACLEGEVKSRDARIAELKRDSARLRQMEGPFLSVIEYANQVFSNYGESCHKSLIDDHKQLRAELAAIKAQEPESSPYGFRRIGWELERTAMGDGFYGNALRVAKDIPGITPEERSLLDRYATGNNKGMEHMRLQDLAMRIHWMEAPVAMLANAPAAPALPKDAIMVGRSELALVRNALALDCEQGRPIRGEMLAELDASIDRLDKLYAAPVSEAEAQGVYSTDPLACSGCASGCFRCRDGAKAQGDYGDAYQGAREDLAIWKRRALETDMQQPDDEPLCRLSAAQAVIDGLRGEVAELRRRADSHAERMIKMADKEDQQTQRIGELEGLLREERTYASVPSSCQQGIVARCICRNCRLLRIDAALSAGKQGE